MTWSAEGPAYDFTGATVVVTGAAQGIGRALSESFASAGALVVVADHNGDQAARTAAEISDAHGTAVPFEVDVTEESQVVDLIRFADSQDGVFAVLVNNAGISTTGLIEDVDVRDWRRVVDVNLNGPFLTCRSALPILRRNGGGRIVNIASVAAKRISSNMAASYTASKAGLVALTRHLAYEAAPWNITVNALCPGPVAAPMLYDTVAPDVVAARIANIPMGRLTTPEDQAEAVLFLASPGASMITGVALDVDGGALLGWIDVATYYGRRGVELGARAAHQSEEST